MTLVVAVNGPKSIWLLTDRRISYPSREPKDDARKLLILDCTDGVALLGYTGLGSTIGGTEPSDWMGRVIRGRKLPLEASLEVLAQAVRLNLPQHLESLRIPGVPSHTIVVTAFLRGEPRLYSIDLARPPSRKGYLFRFTRHVTSKQTKLGQVAPRVAVGGSGAAHLISDRKWARELVNIIKAHDNGRISPQAVAVYLAQLNHNVHLATTNTDNSVGPRCIVAWRFQQGGGGHDLFSGLDRETNSSMVRLPTIVDGMDLNDIVQVIMPYLIKGINAGESKELDEGEINSELAHLPHQPDDKID